MSEESSVLKGELLLKFIEEPDGSLPEILIKIRDAIGKRWSEIEELSKFSTEIGRIERLELSGSTMRPAVSSYSMSIG